MKFMGSKRRIRKFILPIILENRKRGQYYVEPFVGGGNSLERVKNPRIAADKDHYLISIYKALQNNWTPPDFISEKFYNDIKKDKNNFPPELVGYVGYSMSFGGKFFGGYRRDKKGDYSLENMKTQSRRSLNAILKQKELLKGAEFYCCDYRELHIPVNSIIYCDIPYANTTKYRIGFNHALFFNWCRLMYKQGHTIFVSEYTAPEDFICVWSKEVITGLDTKTTKKDIEKLFTLRY